MISTNQFKTGMTISLDGVLFTILDFQHVKPGKGQAFVRTKLRNLKTDAVIDRTFRAGEKVKLAHIERRPMQYLYRDQTNYLFMDLENFEQHPLSSHQMADSQKYLKEGQEVQVLFYQARPIGLELPVTVDLQVTETDPGLRGDTATGGTKPATLETGLVVQVPLFVQRGDRVRVDTRTGEYVTRV